MACRVGISDKTPKGLSIVALVGLLLLLAGCGTSAGASRQESAIQPESQRAIATAIAVKAQGGQQSTPNTVTSSGPRSVTDILASAPTSGLLDSKHLAAGNGCEACHGKLPTEGRPAMPTTATCLSCHGGSYDALASKTANAPGGVNPHKAHTGKLDCDRCHRVHGSFEYSCNNCHSFPVPERFRAG